MTDKFISQPRYRRGGIEHNTLYIVRAGTLDPIGQIYLNDLGSKRRSEERVALGKRILAALNDHPHGATK
jgi:hypothetical protein